MVDIIGDCANPDSSFHEHSFEEASTRGATASSH